MYIQYVCNVRTILYTIQSFVTIEHKRLEGDYLCNESRTFGQKLLAGKPYQKYLPIHWITPANCHLF